MELSPKRLETQFAEKAPAYSPAEAAAEAARCLYCHDAPCITACPTAIDIPTFIRKIATKNTRGAARTILSANLLGASCSRVCPVEVLCEGSCVYVPWGRRPISIGRLQRFAMDQSASPELLPKSEKKTGRKIALVGAGPASLACGGTLALLGHEAVLYERDETPGGLNASGVAPYKMNAETALAEVEFVRSLGVEIRTGVEIGTDVTPEELLNDHDAVFLGTGLGADSPLYADNSSGEGVIGAVEWIRRMKLDPEYSLEGVQKAAVIGGGNTAIDVVRELLGLGVRYVALVYRRGEAEMGGYQHEWIGAHAEGAALLENALVSAVIRDPLGQVEALDLVRAENGKPTETRLSRLPVDLVVVATGQSKLREIAESFPDVKCDERGRVLADEATGRTGNERVYCGGDARNGGKEVVNAVDEGQRAARAIDAYLKGLGDA